MADLVRDRLRKALKPVAPNWLVAVSLYSTNKPYGLRAKGLVVRVLSHPAPLYCRACHKAQVIAAGSVLDERCPLCRSYEVVWVEDFPDTEIVRQEGGGRSDPMSGRGFCMDLERWCEDLAWRDFGIPHAGRLMFMRYVGDDNVGPMGLRGIAKSLGLVSARTLGRLWDAWKEEWDEN